MQQSGRVDLIQMLVQVSGGSQSFNAVNSLRLLGRWIRIFTIPNSRRWQWRTRSSTRTAGCGHRAITSASSK